MTFDEREHNLAAWLCQPNQSSLEVLGAEFPTNVKPEHVIIRVRACAINPVDCLMQDHDIFGSVYPTILGCDVAGEIFDISETIPDSKFTEGDRVMAEANAIGSRDPAEGGFQKFVSCHADLVSRIPDRMSFVDAATLPLAMTTAGQGLYGKGYLELPLPSLHPKEAGESVIIWGASGSVGSAAVQLATASGMHVIATASRKHHDFVGFLGAHAVYDYNDADVDEQILGLVNSRRLVGVFDAIGTPKSRTPIYSLLEQLGGGFVASVSEPPKDTPGNVRARLIAAESFHSTDPGVARFLMGDFLPAALEKGTIKPAPPALVVGQGLDKIQKGVEILKKGVSAQKLVVEI